MNNLLKFKEYRKLSDEKYSSKEEIDEKHMLALMFVMIWIFLVAFIFNLKGSLALFLVLAPLSVTWIFGENLLYYCIDKKQKIKRAVKNTIIDFELFEIFNIDDKMTKDVFQSREKEIEDDIFKNGFLSNNMIFSLLDEIGILNYEKSKIDEIELKERIRQEEKEALINAETRAGLQFSQIKRIIE